MAIFPASDSTDSFYIDVWNGGRILSKRELCKGLGEWQNMHQSEVLSPASVPSMLSRISRNILNAINRRPNGGMELAWPSAISCLYARSRSLRPEQGL